MKKKFATIITVVIVLIFTFFYSLAEIRSIKRRELDLFYRNLNVYDEISNYTNSLESSDIVSEVHYLTLINNEINNCGSIYLCDDFITKMDANKYMLSFISSLQLYSWALQQQYFDKKNELVDFDKVSNDIMEIALIIKDFGRNENFDELHNIIIQNSEIYLENDILEIYFRFLNGENVEIEDVGIPYK